jgi:hypothetical protein
VALVAIAIGALLLLCPLLFDLDGPSRWFALGSGIAGVLLGSLYLLSPTWKIEVVAGDEALEVSSRGDRKFLLRWDQVERVIASPSTRTCFVDGGDPARSLLVPGDDAPAPYAIEDRDRLYELILARVEPDRVTEVGTLIGYQRQAHSPDTPETTPEDKPETTPEATEAKPEATPETKPET